MSIEHDLLVRTLLQDRERAARESAMVQALMRAAGPTRDRRHSLRERLGFSLIQAGRALLRRRPAYAMAARRVA